MNLDRGALESSSSHSQCGHREEIPPLCSTLLIWLFWLAYWGWMAKPDSLGAQTVNLTSRNNLMKGQKAQFEVFANHSEVVSVWKGNVEVWLLEPLYSGDIFPPWRFIGTSCSYFYLVKQNLRFTGSGEAYHNFIFLFALEPFWVIWVLLNHFWVVAFDGWFCLRALPVNSLGNYHWVKKYSGHGGRGERKFSKASWNLATTQIQGLQKWTLLCHSHSGGFQGMEGCVSFLLCLPPTHSVYFNPSRRTAQTLGRAGFW